MQDNLLTNASNIITIVLTTNCDFAQASVITLSGLNSTQVHHTLSPQLQHPLAGRTSPQVLQSTLVCLLSSNSVRKVTLLDVV